MLPPIIEFLKDKKVLILGFGREGRSTYNYIRKYLPEKMLGIGDGREQKIDDNNVEYYCGEDYLSHIGKFQVVMKSPGISFVNVDVPDGTYVTCQTDLFLKLEVLLLSLLVLLHLGHYKTNLIHHRII
jgi:UDP-N-acetylmuramoylalanine--D-glutamate ligase